MYKHPACNATPALHPPMMLQRVLTSPVTLGTAYCEDHLPHDADILQICPRFQYLGQLHPRPVRRGPNALPVTIAWLVLLSFYYTQCEG